jgi:hypothetical protein
MGYNKKGHYGHYSGNAHHSKHHMVNSWEEEDVKRGRKLEEEGHKGHAEALFDDAHGSYNYDGHNSTGAEHHGSGKMLGDRNNNGVMEGWEKAIKDKIEGAGKSRKGDRVSWKYGDGTYSGTCINDSCSQARTENGKIKYLPKNKK